VIYVPVIVKYKYIHKFYEENLKHRIKYDFLTINISH
jgi:hypothetical protein